MINLSTIKDIDNQEFYINLLDIKNRIKNTRESMFSLAFFISLSILFCFSLFYFSAQYIYELNILDTPIVNIVILIILFILTLIGTFISTSLSKNIFYEMCGSNIAEKYSNGFQTTYNAKDLITLRHKIKKLNSKEESFFNKHYYYLNANNKSEITYKLLSEWISNNSKKDIEKEKTNILFIVNNNLNIEDLERLFHSYETNNIHVIRLLWKNKELRLLVQKKYLDLYNCLNNKFLTDKINEF
jgi:hypothetical protein